MNEYLKIEKAMKLIADVFELNETYTNRQGVVTTINRLAYSQERALGALPQALEFSIRYNEGNPDQLPALKAAVIKANRENKNDELSAQAIAKANRDYKRRLVQVEVEGHALEVAKQAFLKLTGKAFVYYDKGKVNQDVARTSISEAMAESERLLGFAVNADPAINSQ